MEQDIIDRKCAGTTTLTKAIRGYKKVYMDRGVPDYNYAIIELIIPPGARIVRPINMSGRPSKQLRADRAIPDKVKYTSFLRGNWLLSELRFLSHYDRSFEYVIGREVTASLDTTLQKRRAGVHFFSEYEEAKAFYFV